MNKIRINIDGKEIYCVPGQTILEVALENDIYIPTFCYDERTEIYGQCGMCVVEVEGNPKLVRSCATPVTKDMIISTKSERVIESRKTNLELLLSNHTGDCRPPCALNCPAGTDCQGYVGLIANGQYEEALKLIKENIPLPASIGRVCTHPCEDNCRRRLIEEPVSIAWLKMFAADQDLANASSYIPEIEPETGKKVAVIGGGPFGLSAAYFLRRMGHGVTLFDAMPKMGGMLRYGIPEYRLPKGVVDTEVGLIEKMGVEMRPNTKIGEDISFEAIRKQYDAVLIGIGAWVSTGVGCPGEDADGVIGGIDFLRKVVKNEKVDLFGKRVAIVGGGNSSMDACRTALRLGASEVYDIYRRTMDEMPAASYEIREAEEEGVIFKNLRNPKEIIKDENGRAVRMELQVMELGEPDASGRRSPKAVPGKTEMLDIDTIILTIGQAVNPKGFDGLDLTRKKGIVYDKETYMTSIEGVFAGGDCGNDKISIAVESIADAKKMSGVVDAYLNGEKIKYTKPYVSERDDINEKTFEDRERLFRPEMPTLSPEDRKNDFREMFAGYSPEHAEEEASRCLECGCHDYFECKLVDIANKYNIDPERFKGDVNKIDYDDKHPFIMRDPNKCILCGLCVRVCDQVMGVGALGLVHRGFETVVMPAIEKPLTESGCKSCGQCVSVCPTGALGERLSLKKQVPLQTVKTQTTCSFCSIGCSLELESYGNMLIRAVPDKDGPVNAGLLCGKGKFGFDLAESEGKLTSPLVKFSGEVREASVYDALTMTTKKIGGLLSQYGSDAIAVSVSDRYTNEEAYAIKKMADMYGVKTLCFNNRPSGLKKVLGMDVSPNAIEELLSSETILVFGYEESRNPVLQIKLSQAAKNGAKVVIVNTDDMQEKYYGDFASVVCTSNNLNFLKSMAKSLVDSGKSSDAEGFEDFKNSLAGAAADAEAKKLAELYAGSKKAMLVYQQSMISPEAAELLAEIAVLSGHIGGARDGILQIKAKNNSQGLVDMGITAGAEALDGVKALMVFGEDPDADLSGLEFLMVSDTHLTETGKKADVVFPASGFASVYGTFTNTEGRLQAVNAAIDEESVIDNISLVNMLAEHFFLNLNFGGTDDASEEMMREFEGYREADLDVVIGAKKPKKVTFFKTEDAPMVTPMLNSDALMNRISELLPTAE